MKCEHCQSELQPLNPPVEDYLAHKFCIKIFGWKLIFLKDPIEIGCIDCMQSRDRLCFRDAVYETINEEIRRGHLIERNNHE